MEPILNEAVEKYILTQFAERVEHERQYLINEFAEHVVHKLKARNPKFADDHAVLSHLIRKERFDVIKDHSYIGIRRASEIAGNADLAWIMSTEEVRAAAMTKIASNPYSQAVINAIEALHAWSEKYGNPFDIDNLHKNGRLQYRVGYVRCTKAQYEEIAPHLELLAIVKDLRSSAPERAEPAAKKAKK